MCICYRGQRVATASIDRKVKLTDCSSNFCCCLFLSTMRSSSSFRFFSSYSSACNLSLVFCLLSMSALRLCVVLDEFCDSVPSKPPNSRCPRRLSSASPFTRRPVTRFVEAISGCSWCSRPGSAVVALRRRRLFSGFDADDPRRFCGPGDDGSSSGRTTAEAMVLVGTAQRSTEVQQNQTPSYW